MDIRDKVIVVTGGGKGIGRAVAQRLAANGAKLVILDLDNPAMIETVQLVEAAGGDAKYYECDVTEESAVEHAFIQVVKDFGAIHGLVNNAGVLRDGLLIKVKDGKVVKKMSTDQFNFVVDAHMKGAFLCAREAAAHMVECGVEEGCIVSLSSAAFRGNFGQTNYSAAKAGIVAMTRVWSLELARYNIRAMAIAPGTIETDMLRSMPSDALSKLSDLVPLKRIGQVNNIAQTVQHVLENDYMSGGVIDVNGGLFM